MHTIDQKLLVALNQVLDKINAAPDCAFGAFLAWASADSAKGYCLYPLGPGLSPKCGGFIEMNFNERQLLPSIVSVPLPVDPPLL